MLIVLLRDGISFYSITFCATFAAVLVWALTPQAYYGLPFYTTWSITSMSTSHFLLSLKYSQTVRQSWNQRIDISTYCVPTSELSNRPSGKPIEMDYKRDWKGRTLSADSSATMSSRSDLPILHTHYDAPNGRRTCSPQAPTTSQTVLIKTQTAMRLQDHQHRCLASATVNERRGFDSWWWWWLLGRGAVVENLMVEVDVSHAEWWDEWEDRGPGWQESKIGRYDGWL